MMRERKCWGKSVRERMAVWLERDQQLFHSQYIVSCASGCWLWQGALDSYGYGVFRSTKAHRYSHELYIGPKPDDLVIDHICNTRSCINPEHLRLITNAENVLRGNGITAQNARRTRCRKGHPFNEENTLMRADGSRACRICHNAKRRRQHAARAAYRAAVQRKQG